MNVTCGGVVEEADVAADETEVDADEAETAVDEGDAVEESFLAARPLSFTTSAWKCFA
jgi:hypothetical protein